MDLLDNVATELGFEFHLYVVRDQLFGSKQQRNVKDFIRSNKKQSTVAHQQQQQSQQPNSGPGTSIGSSSSSTTSSTSSTSTPTSDRKASTSRKSSLKSGQNSTEDLDSSNCKYKRTSTLRKYCLVFRASPHIVARILKRTRLRHSKTIFRSLLMVENREKLSQKL